MEGNKNKRAIKRGMGFLELNDRERKVKQMLADFPKDKTIRILDIGPAEGVFLKELPPNFEKYAVDIVPRDLPGVTLRIADMNSDEIPFPDGFFDVILCCEVIEHLWNPDNIMFQMNKKLKEGGTVILSTPNITSISSRMQALMGKVPGVQGQAISLARVPYNHIRCYNPPSLKYLFELYGFEVAKSEGAASNGFVLRRLLEQYPPFALFVVMQTTKRREAQPVTSVNDGKVHFK